LIDAINVQKKSDRQKTEEKNKQTNTAINKTKKKYSRFELNLSRLLVVGCVSQWAAHSAERAGSSSSAAQEKQRGAKRLTN